MSSSAQDNASESKNPVVRVKGFQKTSTASPPEAPPSSTAEIPPVKPAAPRFKPRVSSPSPVEEAVARTMEEVPAPTEDVPAVEDSAVTTEPFEEPPVTPAETFEEPFEEAPVAALPANKEPDPVATPTAPNSAAIRQRFRAEPAPSPVETAMAAPAASPPAPARQKYEPDSDADRIIRRQWWKHNLYVKSGRQKDEAPQQEV